MFKLVGKTDKFARLKNFIHLRKIEKQVENELQKEVSYR